MQRPKFRTKDLLLMLLPAVALATFAISMRKHSGASTQLSLTREPLPLVVESLKAEPVTPKQASEGYSSKVVMTINHAGQTPPRWGKSRYDLAGYYYVQGVDPFHQRIETDKRVEFVFGGALVSGNGQPVGWLTKPDLRDVNVGQPWYDPATDRYKIEYLLPVSQVPAKAGQLTFLGVFGSGKKVIEPLRLVVRKAGEKAAMPDVSRDSPLEVENIRVSSVDSMRSPTGDKEIAVVVTLRDKEQTSERWTKPGSWSMVSSRFLTKRPYRPIHPNRSITSAGFSDPVYDKNTGRYIATFELDISNVPANAGRIIFKAGISVNDSWPVPVSAVVRQ